jgi:glutamate N-acetyltransferase / amino-acid N-acetyltransferase
MQIREITGGVCAPQGFTASGVYAGIRKSKACKDLALIISSVPCAAAAVYTQNKVFGAPILVTRQNIADGVAQAVICNSGNANTCNADGVAVAEQMCSLAAAALGLKPQDIIVASTGVIGQQLAITPIKNAMPELAASLSREGGHAAAKAIMTTDTAVKEAAVEFSLGNQVCRIGAIAKGSGMIHPNMATMLCFITTDVAISQGLLARALKEAMDVSINMVSIDGDTSTNDMTSIMANGLASNVKIQEDGPDYQAFCQALQIISIAMAKKLAADGEGATKLLECTVNSAPDLRTARAVAKTIISSSLTKAAMFGADANWGRILCAIGYAEGNFRVDTIGVSFSSAKGQIEVCRNGAGIDFSEELAKEILLQPEIQIKIDMGQGDAQATAWGCDLTYDYVKINGDYRT